MTLLRDLIDIPEQVHQGDFVLRLSEGLEKGKETLRSYVVTPQLSKSFVEAARLVGAAVKERSSKGALLHGSFGSGKSHFMAVLHLLLQGNPDARSVPELAPAVTEVDTWAKGKKFLLVPYHVIGAKNLEAAILGGYVRYVRKVHPGASMPGVYLSDGVVQNAAELRSSMGDAAFFKLLNSGGGNAGEEWGSLGAGWDAASFDAAVAGASDSDGRAKLVGDLAATVFRLLPGQAVGSGEGFVPIDHGLSLISKHAQGLGYDAVVLFLDELILWLSGFIGNLSFAESEGSKLVKLVEAETYERPVPIISFVARQRDLKDLVGAHVPGAEKLSFSEILWHMNKRFELISLDDRNLPAIVEKRLLKPKDEAARIRLDEAFRETERVRPEVMNTLLGATGDRAMFRSVYPFSPSLVQTLIAVSGLLQRERTALKLLVQLLVDRRNTLQLGEVVPVGDLFDVLAAGAEPFSQEMKAHFEEAVRLYRQQLLPAVAEDLGLTVEQALALTPGDPNHALFLGNDRIVKTLVLAALAPDVAALKDLTPARLCALNHGSIKAPVEGREATTLLSRLRKWASRVGALRIDGDPNNPVISIQLSKVDVGAILAAGAGEDNPGNRRRKVRELLFSRLGLRSSDEPFQEYDFLWRGTRRSVEVVFTNVREVSDEMLRRTGPDWQLVLDFPFDPDHGSLRDDLSRLDRFREGGNTSSTVCWLPAFFTSATQSDLGRLVVIEHLLAGERFAQATRDLSEVDRSSARMELENLQRSLTQRLGIDLEMAYGIRPDVDTKRIEGGHEPTDHVHSLDPSFGPRPPVGATLGDALTNVLDQLLASLYPAHPRFEEEVKPGMVKKALEELLRAAGEREGRIEVERPLRDVLRQVAMPLGFGKMYESHFILEKDWVNRFDRAIAQAGPGPSAATVGLLRQAIDESRPMGLPRDLQDLLILVSAEQSQRTFHLYGAPYTASIGNLRDELVLREQPLPSEEEWVAAQELSSRLFGVVVSKHRSAANVAALIGKVREEVAKHEAAVSELAGELQGRMAAMGLPDSGARLATARAAKALFGAVKSAAPDRVPAVLADTSVPTSLDALVRSIKGSPQVLDALRRTKWQLLEAVAVLSDGRREAGRLVRDRTAEALEKDEIAIALAPALHDSEERAVQLLSQQPRPVEPARQPDPVVPPAGLKPIPVPVGVKVLKEEVRAELDAPTFGKVSDDIRSTLQQNPGSKLWISWRVEKKG